MLCISVVIIQNSGGSARCTVQIYTLSVQPCGQYNINAHRSLTVACIIKSDVKLCADSWFMQDGLRKCHLSLLWEWFTELRLTVTDRTQRLVFFWRSGDGAETGWVHSFEIISILTENAIASASKMSQSCFNTSILHILYTAWILQSNTPSALNHLLCCLFIATN